MTSLDLYVVVVAVAAAVAPVVVVVVVVLLGLFSESLTGQTFDMIDMKLNAFWQRNQDWRGRPGRQMSRNLIDKRAGKLPAPRGGAHSAQDKCCLSVGRPAGKSDAVGGRRRRRRQQ